MILQFVRVFAVSTLFLCSQLWAFSETKGTPIGGMGTGYIKYDAIKGDFAASSKVPPGGSEQQSEFTSKKSSSCGFHFFAGGEATIKAKTDDEDAKCPLYTANFGKTGDVSFTLNAFGPYKSGDGELNYKLATSPLAFFEITAKNEGSEEKEVAAAMEFSNTSGSKNLLGGADKGKSDGENSITYEGDENDGNAYLTVSCDQEGVTFSSGSIGSFESNGTLESGNGNIVAAKCKLAAGQSVKIKFTMAWWRTFISTKDRYGSGKVDEENYYYHNFFDNSKSVAEFGVEHFDEVSASVKNMVSRVMSSNFPDWYKDRLWNNLYPLVQNSQCAKDGRTAFWEGKYPILGTIDQGEHASIFYTFNWPKNQWQELQFWLRTAHTGEGEDKDLAGQIHHDFNTAPNGWNDESHFMCPWDNYLRDDYWWCSNTTQWSDLNTMLIFKAYELMLATGNRDSVETYYPKVLRTANRLLKQCEAANSKLPIQSHSTYDNEGAVVTAQYASGIALAAFLAIEDMAKFVGDNETAEKYRDWYTAARKEYKDGQFDDQFGTGRNICEGDVAGYSWAHYFGLEPIMDEDFLNEACKRIYTYYKAQTTARAKLGLWHFYTYDHWGGAEIARGQADIAMVSHKWDHDFYYTGNPSMIFWQTLEQTNTDFASYMTGPCVWRSYFQMMGYMLDNAHKRLWIRPSLPSEMDNKIENAGLPNPYGWGTLNYDGNKDGDVCQKIKVSFDSPVKVKQLMLKNNTDFTSAEEPPEVKVKVGGAEVSCHTYAEGSGYTKNIRVVFDDEITIDEAGIEVTVLNAGVGVKGKIGNLKLNTLGVAQNRIVSGKPVNYSVNAAGPVSIDLLSLNGKKVGSIFSGAVSAGNHSFVWNGKTLDGKSINSSMMILRIKSSTGIKSKNVLIGF